MTEDTTRADAWQNAFSGFGTARDRRTHSSYARPVWLDDHTLAALYHFGGLARRIVSLPPSRALAGGITLRGDTQDRVQRELRRLGLLAKIGEAATWGRLFGGGLVYVDADDGGSPASPVQWASVGSIRGIDVYDKRDIRRADGKLAIRPNGATELHVDPSRVFLFGGAKTAKTEQRERDGWDASVLQVAIEALQAFDEGMAATGILLSEASVSVFRLHGLLQALAGGDKAAVTDRAAMMDLTKSVARSVFLDAGHGGGGAEDWRREAVNFAGVPDVLDRMANQVAAATGIPVTLLVGQAPAGLNATGDSDIRTFYDSVAEWRAEEIDPILRRIIRVIARMEGVPEPQFSWPSLWQETPAETSTRRKAVAETDRIYWDMGVLTEDQIAASRFRPEGYSDETTAPTPREASLLEQRPAFEPAPTDAAKAMTTNEMRSSLGLGPLVLPDGQPDPDGKRPFVAYVMGLGVEPPGGALGGGEGAPPAEPRADAADAADAWTGLVRAAAGVLRG